MELRFSNFGSFSGGVADLVLVQPVEEGLIKAGVPDVGRAAVIVGVVVVDLEIRTDLAHEHRDPA